MLRAARELKQLLKKGKKFSKSKLLGVKGRPRKSSLSPARQTPTPERPKKKVKRSGAISVAHIRKARKLFA